MKLEGSYEALNLTIDAKLRTRAYIAQCSKTSPGTIVGGLITTSLVETCHLMEVVSCPI